MAAGAEGKGIEQFNLRAAQASDVLQGGLDTTSAEFQALLQQLQQRFGAQQQQTQATNKSTKRTGFVRKSGKRFVRRRQ